MKEFTGTYNQCNDCGKIYDYNDSCPDCGSDDVQDIYVHEIKETINELQARQIRLTEMLELHGDN